MLADVLETEPESSDEPAAPELTDQAREYESTAMETDMPSVDMEATTSHGLFYSTLGDEFSGEDAPFTVPGAFDGVDWGTPWNLPMQS